MSATVWTWVWASHFKVLPQSSFLCDWQGTVRRAVLYVDRFCWFVLVKVVQVTQYIIGVSYDYVTYFDA